jgi:hypothetical protein
MFLYSPLSKGIKILIDGVKTHESEANKGLSVLVIVPEPKLPFIYKADKTSRFWVFLV